MAARFPMEPPSQAVLMDIAKEIRANKISILATSYLGIDDELLSHIEDEAKTSIQTNFKCLLHWCRNTEEPDVRHALYKKLSRAAKEGLVSQKGANILQQSDPSTSGHNGSKKGNLHLLGNG